MLALLGGDAGAGGGREGEERRWDGGAGGGSFLWLLLGSLEDE